MGEKGKKDGATGGRYGSVQFLKGGHLILKETSKQKLEQVVEITCRYVMKGKSFPTEETAIAKTLEQEDTAYFEGQ